MKLSRTAIKELKSRYLDILKKCAYLNAVIIASSLAVNAASATTLGEFARSEGDGVFDISVQGVDNTYTVTDADLDGSTLGTFGAGNKVIQGADNALGAINSTDYVLDANGNFLNVNVDATSGHLTVQDLTIKNANSVVRVNEGGAATFKNIAIVNSDFVLENLVPLKPVSVSNNGGKVSFENVALDAGVENDGMFDATNSTFTFLGNSAGIANLTNTILEGDEVFFGAVMVSGGTVNLDGSTVVDKTTVGADGSLSATNNTTFVDVENAGTFTANGGSLASLTNTSGTGTLTEATITGTLDVTGGTVNLDGATVADKTTVGTSGSLSATNNTTFADVENAGTFTANGGSLTDLTNTSGTGTLTEATITGALDVTGGTVSLDGATVADKTTVGFGAALNAVDVAMQNVINGGSLTIQGGTLGALNVQGLGLTNLTDVEISGDTNLSYSGNLTATNTVMQHVLNEWGGLGVTGGSLTDLTNIGGTASLTDATITGALDVTGGAVSLHGTTVDGKTTVGANGKVSATGNTSLSDVENAGTFTANGGLLTDLTNSGGTATLTSTQINGPLDATAGTVNLDGTTVGGKTTVGADGTLLSTNGTSLAGVENAGTFTANGGSLADLTNTSGTGTLTDTAITGALNTTGGTVDLDGATVADKTTVGADGSLSAINNTTFADVENAGTFTANGGSLTDLTNTGGTADLTSTKVNGTLNATGGTVDLDGVTVADKTTVGADGTLLATNNTTFENVENEGDFTVNGGSLASLINTGGTAALTDAAITGTLDVIGGTVDLDGATVGGKTTVGADGSLSAINNTTFAAVENAGIFTANGGSLASLTNSGGTAALTSTKVNGTLNATAGTVDLDGVTVADKTTVGADGTLLATNNTRFATVENAGTFTVTDSTLESLSNTNGTATLSSAHVDNTITATGGTVNLDDTVVISKTIVGAAAKLSATNGTSLAGVENAGTFTATDSTLESLSNTNGTATLMSAGVNGSLAITGGDVDLNGSIINGKTTVGANGTLLATNNASLSAVENAGTLNAVNATMQGLTNSGDLTILGGSLASLANTGGKADLTSTQITGALGITGGDVALEDTVVSGKTTVATGTDLTADRTAFSDVIVAGNFTATDSSIAGLTNDLGSVTLTDSIVTGLLSGQGKTNLSGDIQLTGGVSGTGSITNSGNLILGAADNTKYVGTFSQTDGKTIADSNNFFQKSNIISGGILETKGDTIGYTATATGRGAISFESTSSDTSVVHDANKIVLSNVQNGTSTISFKNGTYTLADMGSGTAEDLIKFDNATVQLTANEYAGETYSFNDTTVDLRGNGLSNIQFTGDNLFLSNTDLAFDVKLSKNTDGTLALGSDTITVLNPSNTSSFDLDLTKVQIINNVQLDSGLTTSISKKVLEGVTFNTPINSALVSTDVYQYNVGLKDSQTIELTAIQAANGDSLRAVNQYTGDSAFYMTNLDSRYEMNSSLGTTGTGNKLVQGYTDGSNIIKSTIDANGYSMFDVSNADTNLTVKDVAITDTSSVLTTAQGAGTTTFENVWIHNTTNVGLENGNLVANPIMSNAAGDDTTYGLVLKNVHIQDAEDLIENSGAMNVQNSTLKDLINSGRFNGVNSTLTSVENSGSFTTNGGSISSLLNTAGSTTLIDTTISGVLDVTGGVVGLIGTTTPLTVGGKTTIATDGKLNATNVSFKDVENSGSLASNSSTLGVVTNKGVLTSTEDTIISLDNTGGAELTNTTVTTLTNSGALTANGGSITTLTNQDGTTGLTDTTVGSLTVNKGTVTATGGTIKTLNNAQDGNTKLSDVTNVDTITNDGVLTSGKSKLGTVTNNNSLTSTEDTITSLDNTGGAELTDTTVATLTNSGALTANGGSITTLTNQDGTAKLTNTALTNLNVNGGSVSLNGVANTLSVTGDTNVLSGATLNANNTSFSNISHQGEMNLSGAVHFAGTIEGAGTINNSGNLTFGSENVKTFTGEFNQTGGKTIADSENFFQGVNTISGGILETKGDTIGYTATATGNGIISFESTTSDETVVHNANKIVLSDGEVGTSTISFKNGTYTLTDMGSGTVEDLIKFDNATVQLTANEYAGETYQFDNSTINMQDDIYSVVNMQNVAGSNTTLAVDIGLVSNAIDGGFNGVIAKSDVLNVTGDNAFVVANANFKVVPTGVNNQDANKDDGTSTSYTVQVLQGNATFADALKGSTSFNAVTNAYTYNAIISDDLQTVELKAFKTTDGNSLTHINQYAGNSNFYMSVDGETGSTYQMTSDLGATGIGEKLILGAVAGDASASIIDANNHSMFEVSDASTKLTVQDLTIKNAISILTMTNGNAILDNVIIDTLANTAPTVVIDNLSTSGEYGLVLNNVQINDANALLANSGTMKSSNSNLQGVTNEGTFVAEGGSITTLTNQDGTAGLTDTTVGTLTVNKGTVTATGGSIETLNNAQDGNTKLSGVTNVDTITNDGVLTSGKSKLGTVTNNNSLTSTEDTITSLDNTGSAGLTNTTVATLTNSGTLTVEGGSITTLTNQDGTTGLTNTTVGSLTVNKGTLTATGGTIKTLNNAQDGNTKLSGVTNVDTITNDGVLTSGKSKLGTVTNNNSLTSTEDTITSLDNTGGATLTDTTVATLTNSGTLTVEGGSITTLTNQDGTTGLTNTTVGLLTVNNGTLTATGGTIKTLNNAQDGNTTLSGVTNVDTITNDGKLTSSNSKLGTVTNNNSLTSTEDTITSLDNTGNATLTGSMVTTVENKGTGTLTVQGNSVIENASNLGTINVDNSTFASVENNNQMIATGNLSITNALTGNGTLTMNGATLNVKDGFATSNNLVSNNMQFGEDIKTIEVANLTVQNDTNLDIRNIDVTAQEITLENGSTLNVQLNDRSDYGSLIGTNLISEEDSKIDFDLGENFEMGLYNVLKMDAISSLPTAVHNDEGFNFLDLEDGRYSFISKDSSKISNQYGSDKNQTAAIIALHEGRGTNELFNKAQTELIEHLQSGNAALIKKAVKALDNLGGNVSPVVQSIASSHFKGITDAVSDQVKLSSKVEGTSGGDETQNAQVWVKALYGHAKYDDKGDFKANETGFVAGIQKQITDTLTVGVGYAYGYADIAQSGRDTTAQTNTGFAFARYQPNKWFVEGVVSYSRSQYEESKNILSTASDGMYNVDTFAVQAMAGYDFSCRDLIITPKLGLKYMDINQEAYVDSLDTHIDNNTYRYMTAMAGIDIRAPYKTVHGLYIRPTAGVMFGYDIISDDTGSINTLSNGAVYTAEGNALDRFSTNVNLGIDAELGDLTTLSVEYLGSFRKSYQEHGGMMKLKQNF